MTDEPTPRCALPSCRAPFIPVQKTQRYCCKRHLKTAQKRRERERKRYGATVKEIVTERLGDADTLPADDGSDEAGIVEGPGHDPFEERAAAFLARVEFGERTERVRRRYEARLAVYAETQRRNPGRVLPEIERLTRERNARIAAIERDFYLEEARMLAEKTAPARVASAHERQVEKAASVALARDLGRGRHLRDDPSDAGRDVWSAWRW